MKKRPIFVAVSCLLGLCFLLSFAACGGGNIKKEFGEFENMMLTILDDARNGSAESSSAAVASGASIGKTSATVLTSAVSSIFAESDAVFAKLDETGEKESYNVWSFYADAVEQTMCVPLYCGYALTNFFAAESLYKNNLYFESWAQTVRIEKDDYTYFYVYTDNSDNNRDDMYLYGIVDYKNENDYEFLWHQFNADLNERLLVYGNSQSVFLMASASENDKVESGEGIGNSDSNNFVYFRDGKTGYNVYGEDAVNEINGMVASRFSEIDRRKIDGIRDNAQYSLDDGRLIEITMHYGDYGGPVEETGEWIVDSEGVHGVQRKQYARRACSAVGGNGDIGLFRFTRRR